jgi:hypothetical protein
LDCRQESRAKRLRGIKQNSASHLKPRRNIRNRRGQSPRINERLDQILTRLSGTGLQQRQIPSEGAPNFVQSSNEDAGNAFWEVMRLFHQILGKNGWSEAKE